MLLLAASSLALPHRHHTRPLLENLGDGDAPGEENPVSLISDDPDFERKAAEWGLYEQFGLATRNDITNTMGSVKLVRVSRDLTCGDTFDYQRRWSSRDFEFWQATYEPEGKHSTKNQVKVYIDQQCAENALELGAYFETIETFQDGKDAKGCVLKWGVAKMAIPVTGKDNKGKKKKVKTETKQVYMVVLKADETPFQRRFATTALFRWMEWGIMELVTGVAATYAGIAGGLILAFLAPAFALTFGGGVVAAIIGAYLGVLCTKLINLVYNMFGKDLYQVPSLKNPATWPKLPDPDGSKNEKKKLAQSFDHEMDLPNENFPEHVDIKNMEPITCKKKKDDTFVEDLERPVSPGSWALHSLEALEELMMGPRRAHASALERESPHDPKFRVGAPHPLDSYAVDFGRFNMDGEDRYADTRTVVPYDPASSAAALERRGASGELKKDKAKEWAFKDAFYNMGQLLMSKNNKCLGKLAGVPCGPLVGHLVEGTGDCGQDIDYQSKALEATRSFTAARYEFNGQQIVTFIEDPCLDFTPEVNDDNSPKPHNTSITSPVLMAKNMPKSIQLMTREMQKKYWLRPEEAPGGVLKKPAKCIECKDTKRTNKAAKLGVACCKAVCELTWGLSATSLKDETLGAAAYKQRKENFCKNIDGKKGCKGWNQGWKKELADNAMDMRVPFLALVKKTKNKSWKKVNWPYMHRFMGTAYFKQHINNALMASKEMKPKLKKIVDKMGSQSSFSDDGKLGFLGNMDATSVQDLTDTIQAAGFGVALGKMSADFAGSFAGAVVGGFGGNWAGVALNKFKEFYSGVVLYDIPLIKGVTWS